MGLKNFIDLKLYPQYKDNWDNDFFREIVLKYIHESYVCLDIGAGRGALIQMNFKGLAKKISGIDPSNSVYLNPYLDEAVVGYGEEMPFLDSQFNVVYANNVLEHIKYPDGFLKEVNRVLINDGVFIAKTPNKFHYMPLLATILPDSIHNWYHEMKGRPSHDTFPTFYKINSIKSVKKYAVQNGFKIEKIIMKEGRPEYLRSNPITYLFGFFYERIVNLLSLNSLKVVMYIVLRKV